MTWLLFKSQISNSEAKHLRNFVAKSSSLLKVVKWLAQSHTLNTILIVWGELKLVY